MANELPIHACIFSVIKISVSYSTAARYRALHPNTQREKEKCVFDILEASWVCNAKSVIAQSRIVVYCCCIINFIHVSNFGPHSRHKRNRYLFYCAENERTIQRETHHLEIMRRIYFCCVWNGSSFLCTATDDDDIKSTNSTCTSR